MLKKRTGSVDNSFFVKNFSQESKNHFDNLLAIFNDMTKYSYDNTFDFNSFAKSSLDHIDDVEKQVVFDVKISKQEKQLILVASTLITAALFSMEGTSKLLSSSQNNGRVNCFFCSVWQGIVKFTSVVVAIVVNVVAGTMISFFSGLLEGGPLAAPFCAVGGAFVGLFYGIRDGIVCDSYDFDCMLQSLMPPDDYPCFVEV